MLLSGKAKSTCNTLPSPLRVLPSRSPNPTSRQKTRIAVADGAASPGSAHIREDGRADPNQPEGIPVGENSLLQGKKSARSARFVAQWIAAQPVVAAEQELHVRVQGIRDSPRERRIQQPIGPPTPVVFGGPVGDQVARAAALHSSGEIAGQEQLLVVRQLEAADQRGGGDQRAAIRSESRVRPSDLSGYRRAEVQVLGSADFILIARLLVFVLQYVESDERVGQRPVRGQLLGRQARDRGSQE